MKMAKCKIDKDGNIVCGATQQTKPIIMMSGTHCGYCHDALRKLEPLIKRGEMIVFNEKDPEYPALSKKHNLRSEGVPTFEIDGVTCDFEGIKDNNAEFVFKDGSIKKINLPKTLVI